MFYTSAIVFITFWLLALVTAFSVGAFTHVLLVGAVVVILVRLVQWRGAPDASG